MLGTTFGGNQLACAAALAVLEVIEQENLIRAGKAARHVSHQQIKKYQQP
jgi:acetylornithine aminotransferase